ncbi:InlB B-repeat-containing protein, partial [Candidatus Saccharibacteria bacterium]|nr:InlB B-repeat-containing protein [Candidatus Saccharibacteria bacterium]
TYPITIDNSFNAYKEVPNEYTKVAHRDSSTDIGEDAEGATLISTYASYISKTQAAGAYAGKVIYTLVHPSNEEPLQPQPAKPGKIVYHPNNSSVQGQMGDQDATNSAETTLWASNFKRDGYGFAGWNTSFDYSGTNYGPNQTITAPADVETNGLSLYAVWIKSQGTIQNWNGCSSLAQGSTTALTDERDGNTYAVAKLADGRCWTIENLRLDNTPELTSANTHNPSLSLTNSWWYSSANDSDTKPTSNHLSATTDPTATAWCNTNSSNCNDQSMLATNNTTLFTNNTASSYSTSSNVYSYGNYYNWYSATAGHGKHTIDSTQYIAPGDICPAGWHLPTGGSASAEFGALDVAMGGTGAYQSTAEASNRWRTYPNNFVYSGTVRGSSVAFRNSEGYYWSSSATFNGFGVYHLRLGSSTVYPVSDDYNKRYGRMVRCVAGNPSN